MLTSERYAQRFTEFIRAREQQTLDVRYQANKLNARRVGEEAGVRIPKLFGQYDRISDVDFSKLPDRFVLKPVNMFGKSGVYLLHRQSDGGYRSLMSGQTLTEKQIRTEIAELLATVTHSDGTMFIAEELIQGENGPDEVPYDYKFYTFDGRPELIIQINRNGIPEGKAARVAFFRADFEPLPPNLIKLGMKAAPDEPKRPANWQSLVDAANRIATHLDEPFISVDMYTTGSEAVLGELTPGPGGPYGGTLFYLRPAFDGELGGYWRQGLLRRGQAIPKITGVPPAVRRHEMGRKDRVREALSFVRTLVEPRSR